MEFILYFNQCEDVFRFKLVGRYTTRTTTDDLDESDGYQINLDNLNALYFNSKQEMNFWEQFLKKVVESAKGKDSYERQSRTEVFIAVNQVPSNIFPFAQQYKKSIDGVGQSYLWKAHAKCATNRCLNKKKNRCNVILNAAIVYAEANNNVRLSTYKNS